jgi:hypothetical protein
MAKRNRQQPLNPHFPSGPKTVTLDLTEHQWWALLNTLKARTDYFKTMRFQLIKLNDDGLKAHIDQYTDCMEDTVSVLQSLQEQIAPLYWTKAKRAEYRRQRIDEPGFP